MEFFEYSWSYGVITDVSSRDEARVYRQKQQNAGWARRTMCKWRLTRWAHDRKSGRFITLFVGLTYMDPE